jgi:hypothetical protein
VLQATLTKAETTLVEKDRRELVLLTRTTFQEVMGDDLIAGIEEVTGRTVIAFLSANHIGPRYRDRDVHPRSRRAGARRHRPSATRRGLPGRRVSVTMPR